LEESSISAQFVSETVEEEKPRVLHPGGFWRTAWEILTVMWLLHDVVFIPLQFFDLPESEFLNALSWSTMAFWSVDILMSFRTGVYNKGVLVMDAAAVARKYARTWLPVDVMLVSIDWIALAFEGSRGQHEGTNVLWILRLLRLVRVVRLGKMSRTALVLQEVMQGWAVNVQFSVAMNIIRLLLLNHMIACAWWGFSHIGGRADGWSTKYGVEEEDRLYGYLTSLHWAIAQLGVGATEVEATNLPERTFSIFVALISLITFSTMVSSMTSMMTAYSRSKEEEARHFSLLQRYLLHNKVSVNLSQRITKFLQHAYMAQHQASSQDMHVPLLDMLSRPLMNELQLEKHQKDMERLPFLKAILSWHNVQTVDSMRNLASSSFTVCTVATKDVIFCCGVEALAAYLPITGDVSYLQDGRQAEPCLHVWTAEMCLWTEWYFLGDLIATDVSRILMLDMESFCRTIASNPLMHVLAVQYAKEYTHNLRREAAKARHIFYHFSAIFQLVRDSFLRVQHFGSWRFPSWGLWSRV
ncbi:SKOR, partial [Symbiodinium sp. KB8]